MPDTFKDALKAGWTVQERFPLSDQADGVVMKNPHNGKTLKFIVWPEGQEPAPAPQPILAAVFSYLGRLLWPSPSGR